MLATKDTHAGCMSEAVDGFYDDVMHKCVEAQDCSGVDGTPRYGNTFSRPERTCVTKDKCNAQTDGNDDKNYYVDQDTNTCVASVNCSNGMVGNDILTATNNRQGYCVPHEDCISTTQGYVNALHGYIYEPAQLDTYIAEHPEKKDYRKCVYAREGCGAHDMVGNHIPDAKGVSATEYFRYCIEKTRCIDHTIINTTQIAANGLNLTLYGYVDELEYLCVRATECSSDQIASEITKIYTEKKNDDGTTTVEEADNPKLRYCVSRPDCAKAATLGGLQGYTDTDANLCVEQGQCQTAGYYTRDEEKICIVATGCGPDMVGNDAGDIIIKYDDVYEQSDGSKSLRDEPKEMKVT